MVKLVCICKDSFEIALLPRRPFQEAIIKSLLGCKWTSLQIVWICLHLNLLIKLLTDQKLYYFHNHKISTRSYFKRKVCLVSVDFFFKICLFIGCAASLLLLWLFLSLQWAGAALSCGWASHCSGFFCYRAQILSPRSSGVAVRRLSSYDTEAQLSHGMRDLPRPGIKLVFLACKEYS